MQVLFGIASAHTPRQPRLVNKIRRTDRVTSIINDMECNLLVKRREARWFGIFPALHFDEVAINITDFIPPSPTKDHSNKKPWTVEHNTIPCCITTSHPKSFFVSTITLWNPPDGRLSYWCSYNWLIVDETEHAKESFSYIHLAHHYALFFLTWPDRTFIYFAVTIFYL